MRQFEPIDDLNEEDFLFWLDVTCDILCLEDIERRATAHAKYVKVRNKWRYGGWKKFRR
jgi:hypothetical protein